MTINQLVSTITFKILIGIVLASAMIIFLIYLSQDLHLYLGKLENGDLIQLGSFSFFLVMTATGLFFLFKREVTAASCQTNTSLEALLSCNFKSLGIKFIEGFTSKLLNETEKNK